jgi:iron complex transport system substrate-binding protein
MIALTPPRGPQRIVCLTEETTEWLYLLGEQDRIVGISGYTVRPKHARHEKPKVSAFLSAKIEQIMALKPDLVFGFSDLQAAIANELIRRGIAVMIFNQRHVSEIFEMLLQLSSLVGQRERGRALIQTIQDQLNNMQQRTQTWHKRPRVYFEEWDNPPISAIAWVSELIEIAGGEPCFPELAIESLGKKRIIADPTEIICRNPDIIIGSWCGKKFNAKAVAEREGWQVINAVKNHQLFEIKSADILQPGPAALTDGVAQLHAIILKWRNINSNEKYA